MFQLRIENRRRRNTYAVVLLALSAASFSAHAADARTDRMQRECAEIAGSKTADKQAGVMQECTHGKTSKTHASGMESAEHAKVKSCDTQAKAVDEKERQQFLRECYAGKR
ncbi:MAG TPA: hypothetical protein VI140_09010 [Oxalicibacterium sp.]